MQLYLSASRTNTNTLRPEHVEAYEKIGAKIFRTDRDGAIIININDNKINAKTYAETTAEKNKPDLAIFKNI